MARSLTRQAKYLSQLCARMQQLRWQTDDPLYAHALRAKDAVLALLETTQQVQEQNAQPAWMRAMRR